MHPLKSASRMFYELRVLNCRPELPSGTLCIQIVMFCVVQGSNREPEMATRVWNVPSGTGGPDLQFYYIFMHFILSWHTALSTCSWCFWEELNFNFKASSFSLLLTHVAQRG